MERVLDFICGEMRRLQIDMEYREEMRDYNSITYYVDMELSSKLYEILEIMHDEGIITLQKGVVLYQVKEEKEKLH